MNETIWEMRQRRLVVIDKADALLERMLKENRLMNTEEDTVYKKYLKEINEINIHIETKTDEIRNVDHNVEDQPPWECPICQSLIANSDNFCIGCGTFRDALIQKCACGHINRISDIFCSNCGKSISKK